MTEKKSKNRKIVQFHQVYEFLSLILMIGMPVLSKIDDRHACIKRDFNDRCACIKRFYSVNSRYSYLYIDDVICHCCPMIGAIIPNTAACINKATNVPQWCPLWRHSPKCPIQLTNQIGDLSVRLAHQVADLTMKHRLQSVRLAIRTLI